MTLRFRGTLDHSAVLDATDLVAEMVVRPEVADAWQSESSCAGMSVGGLTLHLANQPMIVVKLMGVGRADGADAETIDVLEHYSRAAWVSEDLDGDANRSIRDTADQQAADGPAAVAAQLSQARVDLASVLIDAPSAVYIPWQGWSLATDDFLVTRLMEMVVHADDLAASIDISTPAFGDAVLDPVFRLLTAVAVRRHGHDALVRTLARPQRAPGTVSAF